MTRRLLLPYQEASLSMTQASTAGDIVTDSPRAVNLSLNQAQAGSLDLRPCAEHHRGATGNTQNRSVNGNLRPPGDERRWPEIEGWIEPRGNA